MEMAGNCKILPAMVPVAVPVSIDGSSDAGGTIWRRKYRALKKKCEEFEQVGTKIFLFLVILTSVLFVLMLGRIYLLCR